MANPLDLLNFARDAYQRTKQPLKERGLPGAQDPTDQGLLSMFSAPVLADMLAPVGTYEDGSVGPAWPKILKGPADAWGRMVDASFRPDLSENELAQMARDSFDAAGLAMTGGFAGAGAGMMDNALGSAGGRIAKGAADLPMDQASRMARAKEMGFDTERPVYHGTNVDFTEFDPDRAIGTQFWTTTDRAAIEAGDVGAQGSGVIKELYHRIKNPAGWAEYDKFGIDELIGRGYDGLALPDGDHMTYVAFKPNQYRDINAAFDPAKSDSANLLAANAKSGAAVPLALEAADQAPVQGIRAYHGTNKEFNVFRPSSDGNTGPGVYLTGSPDEANIYTRSNLDSSSPSIMPVNVRGRLASVADYEAAYDAARASLGSAAEARAAAVETLRRAGFDGVETSVGGVPNYSIFNPGTVYSATTGDLLYANPPTGASIPLGMEANQPEPPEYSVLRQYGLIP